MKLAVIPIIVGALEMVPKVMGKRQGELEIREKVEII